MMKKSLQPEYKRYRQKISIISPSVTKFPEVSKMAVIPTSVPFENYNLSNFLLTYHQVAYILCISPFRIVSSQETEAISGKYQITTSRRQKVKFITKSKNMNWALKIYPRNIISLLFLTRLCLSDNMWDTALLHCIRIRLICQRILRQFRIERKSLLLLRRGILRYPHWFRASSHQTTLDEPG